jgi:hypothetical protein
MDVELFVSCQLTGADRWQTHVCGASRAHVDVRESVPERIENYQCFVTIANVRAMRSQVQEVVAQHVVKTAA